LNSKAKLSGNKFDKQFEEKIVAALKELEKTDQCSPILDDPITHKEVSKIISELPIGKSVGPDEICNEMIKAGKLYLIPQLVILYNLIIHHSIFPTSWCEGLISCLLKKGNKSDPNNYRGLTLSSCLGKVLTKILSNRLLKFLKAHNVISENQAGFMDKRRTTDHIFMLHTIIQMYKKKQKHVFTCFVDFSKAFDSIWREGLFYKLLKNDISTKFCKLLQNMYSKLNSSVKISNDFCTESFKSEVGTRQGCNLSPLVFIIFINDLIDLLKMYNCNPIKLNDQNISLLLFADDIVCISETASGLQRALNLLDQYCKKWKLVVNLDKTKVVIFNCRTTNKYKFLFNSKGVEIVTSYCYLGVIFTNNGSFKTCNLQIKASKAYYALINSIKIENCHNIRVLMKLYNALILPIQLYGAEIWAIPNLGRKVFKQLNWIDKLWAANKSLDCLHLKFCRYVLQVNRFSEKNSILAEIGRYPILINQISAFAKFFFRISQSQNMVLLRKAFGISNSMNDGLVSIYNRLIDNIPFDDQMFNVNIQLKTRIKRVGSIVQLYLKNSFKNVCIKTIANNDGKLIMYKNIKKVFRTEKYLLINMKFECRRAISRIRLSSHKFPIELGRKQGISRENRICPLCSSGEIGDEFHICMVCLNPKLTKLRNMFLNKVNNLIQQSTNIDKQSQWYILLNSTDEILIRIVGTYLMNILNMYTDLVKNV
jgi:hypothetical protein